MLHTYTIQSDDLSEIKEVIRGPEYLACLHDLLQELRRRAKYNDVQVTTWDEAYRLFLDTVRERAIDPIEE